MVRVRYSFSSRRTGHTKNIRKQKKKYPKILSEVLDKADVLIEVLDARFVSETRSLELEKTIKKQGKKLIIVLNKIDLISKDILNKIKELGNFVFVSAKKGKGGSDLRKRVLRECKEVSSQQNKNSALDIDKDKIYVGVIGYPNTGKSSIINLMVKRKVAGTGGKAGFTKGVQKIKLSGNVFLIDSPGVIPADEYSSSKTGNKGLIKHAQIGARSYDKVWDPDMIVAELMKYYSDVIEKYYGIPANGDAEVLIEKLGRRMKFLQKGGVVDEDRTARLILRDWQVGEMKVE